MDHYIATHTGKVRPSSSKTIEDHEINDINNPEGPFGTKRKSEVTAFEWAHSMNRNWLEQIEDGCQEPMKKLGYAKLHKGATASHDHIMVKTAEEVWPAFKVVS